MKIIIPNDKETHKQAEKILTNVLRNEAVEL